MSFSAVSNNHIDMLLSEDEDDDFLNDRPGGGQFINASTALNGSNDGMMHGTLSKWTNYLHGWQDRYVILKNGMLSYYKSEDDVEFGCRGAVSLSKAIVATHELDDLRFDVNLNDSAWYLRATTTQERSKWIETLEFYKSSLYYQTSHTNSHLPSSFPHDSGFDGSENSLSLQRQPSCVSITSGASLPSTTHSTCSFKRNTGLHEKLAEIETFRESLNRQIDTLQNFFDRSYHSSNAFQRGAGDSNTFLSHENSITTKASTLPANITRDARNLSVNGISSKKMAHLRSESSTIKLNDIRESLNNTINNLKTGPPGPYEQVITANNAINNLHHKRTPSLPMPSLLSKIDLFAAGNLLRFDKIFNRATNDIQQNTLLVEPSLDSTASNHNPAASNPTSDTNCQNLTLPPSESALESTNNFTSHESYNNGTITPKKSLKNGFISPRRLPGFSNSLLDFKGEAFTFKATTASLISTLTHCIDLLYQREEHWRKKLEKEIENRKRLELLYKDAQSRNLKNSPLTLGGPDYEEGPHCAIKEDEFFDAVETTLDKFDKEEEVLKQRQELANLQSENFRSALGKLKKRNVPNFDDTQHLPNGHVSSKPVTPTTMVQHKLSPEIDSVFSEQLVNAQINYFIEKNAIQMGTTLSCNGNNNDSYSYSLDQQINGASPNPWQLIAQEGDMKIYKRELEEEGLVCDPLKAIHIVEGVTAREVCRYFFDPNYRYDWETTLETMKVLEILSEDTLIFHQIHKRVWPATQRDSCFWSHIRKVGCSNSDSVAQSGPNPKLSGVCNKNGLLDTWAVCNYSNDHAQANDPNCIRVKLSVFLHCQTFLSQPILNGGTIHSPTTTSSPVDLSSLKRKDVKCKITYCSKINPGGWTPPTVLRAVYKREYPKFLKKFTGYVKEQTKNKDLLF